MIYNLIEACALKPDSIVQKYFPKFNFMTALVTSKQRSGLEEWNISAPIQNTPSFQVETSHSAVSIFVSSCVGLDLGPLGEVGCKISSDKLSLK